MNPQPFIQQLTTETAALLRRLRAPAQEVKHLHQLEREGESEWTPWIAITGLILFFTALGLLMFGVVEGASNLLASVSP